MSVYEFYQRKMHINTNSTGKNYPTLGEQLKADFEFTRLAIPRRVYTQSHFDVMADAIIAVSKRAHEIKHGYKITWEPPILRHFQASLAPIEEK